MIDRPTKTSALTLDLLAEPLAIVGLPAGAPVPAWTTNARVFLCVTRTPTELSIVADASAVPVELRPASVHRAFRVRGPLPLDLVGIFAVLASPLAAAGIPIFPVATFETDYLLVASADLDRATRVLAAAGHVVHSA
jgi:hypothetical protein